MKFEKPKNFSYLLFRNKYMDCCSRFQVKVIKKTEMKQIVKQSKKSTFSCDSRFKERRETEKHHCIKQFSFLYIFLPIGSSFLFCSYTVFRRFHSPLSKYKSASIIIQRHLCATAIFQIFFAFIKLGFPLNIPSFGWSQVAQRFVYSGVLPK